LNWYGKERITFRATDGSGALVEENVLVVVLPVNDPPSIKNIPKQDMREGEPWTLDLSEYISDIDDDVNELKISVRNDAGSDYITIVGHTLIFEYPKDIYDDVITVTISDGEAQHPRTFTANRPRPTEELPSFFDLIPWLLLVILIIGICAFPIYRIQTRYRVHEAFLLYEATVPIAHATQDESSELDEEAVGGMFTAVQSFIKDGNWMRWPLERIKFSLRGQKTCISR
jgi:hypothetical protein